MISCYFRVYQWRLYIEFAERLSPHRRSFEGVGVDDISIRNVETGQSLSLTNITNIFCKIRTGVILYHIKNEECPPKGLKYQYRESRYVSMQLLVDFKILRVNIILKQNNFHRGECIDNNNQVVSVVGVILHLCCVIFLLYRSAKWGKFSIRFKNKQEDRFIESCPRL